MTPVPACPVCRADVAVRAGRGRPATYCSGRCRVAAHRAGGAIPAVLRDRDRWVRHTGKRPVTIDGRPASVTDPGTWTTYAAAKASTIGDGLGYVLGDGVGGIDLDHVIDDHGRLHPAAAELLARLPATYTEVSPSGHGLHLLYRMAPGPGTVRTWHGIHVETYSTGRYFTVTARRWPGAPGGLAALPAAAAGGR